MTHFAVLVLCPSGTTTPEPVLSTLLAPYDEQGEWGRDGSRWDWYTVGGRFTGLLDATYEPDKDPRNLQTCQMCGGTGDRASFRGEPRHNQHPSGCNGCITGADGKATGIEVKWPTQWAPVDTDVMPAINIDMDRLRFVPGAVVTPDGKWHERVEDGYGMFGSKRGDELPEDEWDRQFSALLEAHRDALAVVVDCHV